MRFNLAIDLYLADMRSQGRLTSSSSERAYRDTLYLLGDDVANRDPRTINREDVKAVLRRWSHPQHTAEAPLGASELLRLADGGGASQGQPGSPDT